MNPRLIKYFIVFFFLTLQIFGQHETRAVWVATNFHLDWPSLSYNEETQKTELIKIFTNIKNKNFNTIYFQARSLGTVLFNSDYEPISPYFKGKTGEKPNYDPLEFAIETAHNLGLEIHAWVNTYRCLSGDDISIPKNSWHVMYKHPEWVVKYWENGNVSYWLDPGMPEVRSYLIDVISEIPMKYDIDGIQLDFIRYPGSNFDDDYTYNLYGEGKSKDDWRRESINKFVEELNIAVNRIKPYVKLGAAPIGIYKDIPGAYGLQGFSDVYQDSRTWIKNGWVDYLAPQIYWNNSGNPKFNKLADDWMNSADEKNIVIGIAAYKPEVRNTLDDLISYSRKIGASGVSMYRYSNIAYISIPEFEDKTLPAEMVWLSDKIPSAPMNLSAKTGNANDEFILDWEFNYENDKNTTEYIALYKMKYLSNEFNSADAVLYDIFKADKTSVKVRIKEPKYIQYIFALKSLNKLWEESNSFSNTVGIEIPGLVKIKEMTFPGSKPILIKESENEFRVSIFSEVNEKIEIILAAGTNQSIVSKIELQPGQNIFPITENISGFDYIAIKFLSSGKLTKLKI